MNNNIRVKLLILLIDGVFICNSLIIIIGDEFISSEQINPSYPQEPTCLGKNITCL